MRTICLGDSFTKGFGVDCDKSWVTLLNTPCSTFLNQGVNGDTTGGMLARFYPDVVAHKPNYVLISGGINDFMTGALLPMVQNNYMAMVHQAFHHNIIPIVGIQPAFDMTTVRMDWAEFTDFNVVALQQQDLRNWLLKFCRTFGIFHIDFYGQFEKIAADNPSANYYIDGIHLTADGHSHIAKAAVAALTSII